MRKIKFRAYDKITNAFIYSDQVTGGMWRYFKTLEDRGIRHFESQQFTGLFDKKGKEIYEGAIISFYEELPASKVNEFYYGRGIVKLGEWNCACGDYYCNSIGNGWYVEGKKGYKRRDGRLDEFEFLETIRNCEEWVVLE